MPKNRNGFLYEQKVPFVNIQFVNEEEGKQKELKELTSSLLLHYTWQRI